MYGLTPVQMVFVWVAVSGCGILVVFLVGGVLVGVNRQPKVAPFAPPAEAPEYERWPGLEEAERRVVADMEMDDMLLEMQREGRDLLAEDKARLGRTYPLPRDKRRAA